MLEALEVFPTSVGMNRLSGAKPVCGTGVPHERGDEPRAWRRIWLLSGVFPTSVGMNRAQRHHRSIGGGVPHERGDEPGAVNIARLSVECSPRAWG